MSDPAARAPTEIEMSVKRQRAEDSEGLLDEKGVFMLAVRSLRRQWFDLSMKCKDKDEAEGLRQRMIALEMIPTELTTFVNDYKWAMDWRKKHG